MSCLFKLSTAALGLLVTSLSSLAAVETGGVLREAWFGIGGTSVGDLTGSPAYPDSPGETALHTSFEAPTDVADQYGQRMRAILYPPVSGDYVLTIASDDSSQLLLSTSTDPAGASVIASVNGWTGSRQWDTHASQRSAVIALVAGQGYYIEALQKEGGGGDNLAVAWEGPGIARSVIPGSALAPVSGATGNIPPLASIVVDQAAGVAPFEVQFDASGSKDFDGSLAAYAWDFGDGQSGGGSTTSHTFTLAGTFVTSLTVTDAQGATTSATVEIQVDSDAIPAGSGSGYVLHETWTGLSGTAVADLTAAATFPDAPTERRLLSIAETPSDVGSDFGQRIRGLIHPPLSGDYVFWIACDDSGSLRLSADQDPANLVEIASVNGWTSSREWDKYPSQQSVVITLQAGTAYAFEALAKEAGGGDNLAIAWQGPAWQRELVAGEFLSPPAALPPGDGDGAITRVVFSGVLGTTVADLESHPSYPGSPSLVETLSAFQAPTDVGDNYGQRVRGFLHPPVSGSYRFHIASDDHSVLRLAPNDDHGQVQPIASVDGWTSSQQWDKYAEQASILIDLEYGQVYAIEAVMNEGSGGDNLAVAWTLPGWPLQVIDGGYLSEDLALNQSPVAEGQILGTPAGTEVAVTLQGSDPEGDDLAFEVLTAPTNGALSGVAPALVYTPDSGFVGQDSLTFRVSDGFSSSEPGTVTIDVLAADPSPVDSPIVRAEEFDADAWATNNDYRDEYLATLVPGRVWDASVPVAGVPWLRPTAVPYRRAGPGDTEVLSVLAAPDSPVTFHCTGTGTFVGNEQNTLTVLSDPTTGLATATYLAKGAKGRDTVLVGSPTAVGQVRFVVVVE